MRHTVTYFIKRAMPCRCSLVALKGPLADDPALLENLQRHLFNEEADTRVLGRLSTARAEKECPAPFDEAT